MSDSPAPEPVEPDSRYHHRNLKGTLLAATHQLLLEVDVEALSLRAIARRAGVSHAAPAHHFGSRAGLLATYAVEQYRQLQERMSAAARQDAPLEVRFCGTCREYLDFALDHPTVFNVLQRSELHGDYWPEVQAAGDACLTVLYEIMDEIEVSPLDSKARIIMLHSLLHGYASLAQERNPRRPEDLDEICDGFYRLISR